MINLIADMKNGAFTFIFFTFFIGIPQHIKAQKLKKETEIISDTVYGYIDPVIQVFDQEGEVDTLRALENGKNLVKITVPALKKYGVVLRSANAKIALFRGKKDIFEITPLAEEQVELNIFVNIGGRKVWLQKPENFSAPGKGLIPLHEQAKKGLVFIQKIKIPVLP